MIRPYTIFCVLLAGASGLFLYSKKHETSVLDQNIRAIVRHTDDTRQQIAMLQSQWALLNQPDRLQTLSARFLTNLSPMAPEQYKKLDTAIASLPAPGQRVPHPSALLADAVPQKGATARTIAPDASVMLARNEAILPPKADSGTVPHADVLSHHIVSDRPHDRVQLARAQSAMTRPAAAVPRAREGSHLHYATYHGRRAIATQAMAWREARADRDVPKPRDHFYGNAQRTVADTKHDTQSVFALASDALPPPAPRGD